jgi:phosphoribosylaminoimidazole-succinocarboxamide synthase
VVEFFYKTTGQQFRGHNLGCDDPLMLFSDDGTRLAFYRPNVPVNHEQPLLEMSVSIMEVKERRMLHSQLESCKALALNVNHALSTLWQQVGGDLIDFKIECGCVADGTVVEFMVADVIDCDSWRVIRLGQQLSKQPFRDGMTADDLLSVYQLAEELTQQFPSLARQIMTAG